ncbi:MAG: deoxyribodipyrimidine photolyase [Deltaproteobacteria bacterium]|nr:deoxyribodipyrimidine photolyase [Deltaproteobacteria bacterium]
MSRLTIVNPAPVSTRGAYVLYWMIAARRTTHSFALDHAIARARELERPLLVLEPLRAGYRWASDRFHAFVLQGMADNAAAFRASGVTYYPYVEPEVGHGSGLLEALAKRACLVVTDEQPGFSLPQMVAAAAAKLSVRMEQVDGNGLLPLRAADRAYPTAAAFRRHLQKTLPGQLSAMPDPTPLAKLPRGVRFAELPEAVVRRWPTPTASLLTGSVDALAALPIDHRVSPSHIRGGSVAAGHVLDDFIARKLERYGDGHNHPDDDAASGLSPYLHFGHISAHGAARRVWADSDWDPSRLADAHVTGSREGWWGLPRGAESFLDELVTWRELGYGFCFHRKDHGTWSSLPDWAKRTLIAHASDPRPEQYTLAELESAQTGDPVWNAAQRQLVGEGRIHNYLRMLWGKKILEWSPSPRRSLTTLLELNNKYALDGRDPNSNSGICWTLGLFDRAWPERPIYGQVRYMTSGSTQKKLRLKRYLAQWSAPAQLVLID